ncbi:hypothetical protein ACSRUE_36620 [Sorangium sp. KYC3313]|uniref:hypothetical protein n=1 Tax=Sorangium sp. KYC3313 TaxID=3449740 RepID=UPI003F893810
MATAKARSISAQSSLVASRVRSPRERPSASKMSTRPWYPVRARELSATTLLLAQGKKGS